MSSDLSRRVDAKVISVDYRLAPEDPYPAAVQDARAAYRGLLDSGVDPGSIAIVGESAGGGLAVALLASLAEDGLAQPACTVLLSPWTDLTLSGETMTSMVGIDPVLGARVVRIEDGEPGLAARTIARRLSSVAGLFQYLLARGDAGVASNPVPRGLAGRRAGRRGRGGVRLVRTPQTLPRILSPSEVNGLLGALRTRRDRGMVLAMLLGGLRRCEVLGLRLGDVSVGERRVHIVRRKGGRERIVPVSGRFFGALGEYLELERPGQATTEACFVVLKGPRRGLPLSPSGLDEVLDGAARGACAVHVSSVAPYVLDAVA